MQQVEAGPCEQTCSINCPLQSDAGAVAGGRGPGVYGDAERHSWHTAAHRRHIPAHIPHVCRCSHRAAFIAEWLHLRGHTLYLDAEVLLELARKCQLFLSIGGHAYAFKMRLHTSCKGAIRQEIVETGVDLDFAGGLGCQGRTLGYLLDPGCCCHNFLAVAIAHIEAQASIIGDNVWGHAAMFVDVVGARSRLKVFTHQVETMREELSGVDCAAPQPGTACSVGASTEELDLHLIDRRRAEVAHSGERAGMPVQSDVKIAEESLAGHVNFSAFGLFGGASIQANRARDMLLSHQVFQRDCRPNASCSQQIVAAAMSAANLIFAWLPICNSLIPQTGQSIVLGQEA